MRQITREPASLSVDRDDDSGALVINYSDGTDADDALHGAVDRHGSRSDRAWMQLTDANPQVRSFALGAQEEITWKSKDGTKVGGVLVKPVGYQPGQRYPLIVAIHGGPASADVLSFNGGYGSQVYAGAGYVVLRPNYRGSTNYGVKHKTDIVGNYFRTGFEDIMAGVDYLIAQGIADGSRMGALGWSAGGHWSNWILTHTDRFKAISSGAGHVELDLDVRAERRPAQPPVLPRRQAALRRLRRLLGPVAAQVHQEREDADDDPRRRRRSARAEPAVDRAAHGAQAAGRADRALHVSGQHARHSRPAQPAASSR